MRILKFFRGIAVLLVAAWVVAAFPAPASAETLTLKDAIPKWEEAVKWFSATIKAERPENALSYGLDAKKLSETIFGPENMVTAAVYYNLANTHAALGQRAEAEAHYRLALAIYQRYEEEYGSQALNMPVMNLDELKFIVGVSTVQAQADPEGESHFWRTIRIMGRGPAVPHPRLKVLNDYAAFLRKIGRGTDAKALEGGK